MCFAMSHLRVIHGGKEPPPTEHNLPSHPRLSEELRFGKPPRLLAGFVTSLFGAGAGPPVGIRSERLPAGIRLGLPAASQAGSEGLQAGIRSARPRDRRR